MSPDSLLVERAWSIVRRDILFALFPNFIPLDDWKAALPGSTKLRFSQGQVKSFNAFDNHDFVPYHLRGRIIRRAGRRDWNGRSCSDLLTTRKTQEKTEERFHATLIDGSYSPGVF